MFAVIKTGGKQYIVKTGQRLKIEKLNVGEGDHFKFDHVLFVSKDDDHVEIGKPYINGATVEAKVLKQGRNKKVIVFKYHPKTRYRKTKGHRQPFTEVEITKIVYPKPSV